MKNEKIKNFFYHCDLFSPKPELYINGYTHFPNFFGSLLSLITIIIILISGLFFFATFFTRTINSQIIDKIFSSNFSIPLTEIPIIIQVKNSLFETINNSQDFINITPAIVKQYVITNSQTGQQEKHIDQYFLDLEKCNIDKHLAKFKDKFLNVSQLESYYCIKDIPDKTNLSGIYGEDNFTILNFYLELNSTNTLTEKKEVTVNKVQEEHALNYRIHIKFIDNFIDSKDGKEPIKTALKSDMILFTDILFKREWFYLSRVYFEIDKGYIFSSTSVSVGYESSNYIETIDFDKIIGREKTQSVISFLLNSRETVFRITYIKLPEILANIGGISNGIIYMTQLLLWLFSRRLYTIEVINTLIKKDPDNQTNLSDSKLNIMNNVKRYHTTSLAAKKSEMANSRCINLNWFQYFLPINCTWKAKHIFLYYKKLWILKKNLDVKAILENNLKLFNKKRQPRQLNTLLNNFTIVSYDKMFREND